MRNFYHIFIGFTVMYIIGSLTNFSTFTTESKIIGVPLASLVVGLFGGFVWEWLQGVTIGSDLDKKDVLRSVIGTFLGGVTSIFYPDSNIIMFGFGAISLVLIIADFRIYFKAKNK